MITMINIQAHPATPIRRSSPERLNHSKNIHLQTHFTPTNTNQYLPNSPIPRYPFISLLPFQKENNWFPYLSLPRLVNRYLLHHHQSGPSMSRVHSRPSKYLHHNNSHNKISPRHNLNNLNHKKMQRIHFKGD